MNIYELQEPDGHWRNTNYPDLGKKVVQGTPLLVRGQDPQTVLRKGLDQRSCARISAPRHLTWYWAEPAPWGMQLVNHSARQSPPRKVLNIFTGQPPCWSRSTLMKEDSTKESSKLQVTSTDNRFHHQPWSKSYSTFCASTIVGIHPDLIQTHALGLGSKVKYWDM